MWLLWPSFALLALRYFEVGWFAKLSWWLVAVPFALAFIWFEFIEKRLGLDKKKVMDEMEALKKERLRRAIDPGNRKRRK